MDECSHFMDFAATTDKVTVESASDSEDSSYVKYLRSLPFKKSMISYTLNS